MRPAGGGWRDGGGGGGGGGDHGEERRVEPGRNGMQESSVWKTCVCVGMSCVSAPARADAYMIYTADTATPAEER